MPGEILQHPKEDLFPVFYALTEGPISRPIEPSSKR